MTEGYNCKYIWSLSQSVRAEGTLNLILLNNIQQPWKKYWDILLKYKYKTISIKIYLKYKNVATSKGGAYFQYIYTCKFFKFTNRLI